MMSRMPKQYGPALSRLLNAPSVWNAKLENVATKLPSTKYSPMLLMRPTKEKMMTSAR